MGGTRRTAGKGSLDRHHVAPFSLDPILFPKRRLLPMRLRPPAHSFPLALITSMHLALSACGGGS